MSLEASPLAPLDPTHLGWRQTGAALARASLGDERHVFSLLLGLPPGCSAAWG